MWKFVTSALLKDSWIKSDSTQVCFWGRSNVGKSSLLNALVGRNISFVSKTPGRTQFLNYFADNNQKYIVDLPGYGYAKTPKEKQAVMLKNIQSFLSYEAIKKHVFLLIDARTYITKIDSEIILFLKNANLRVDFVVTKIDKLNQKEKAGLLKQYNENSYIKRLFPESKTFFVSSNKNTNIDVLSEYIESILYK